MFFKASLSLTASFSSLTFLFSILYIWLLYLFIKETSNVTIDFETTSGMFICQLDEKIQNGKYIIGNGTDSYDIETVSGDFIVKPLN